MKIIFLGAPGAGKGTQAAEVSRRFGIPTISTGNMIREAIAGGSPIGIAAKEKIAKGQLLDDETVIGIVRDKLNSIQGGYILDGFPRTIAQAEALEEMGVEIDAVINIYVPDDTIVKRAAGRRYCPGCGATYHTEYNPPQKKVDGESGDGVCTLCGTPVAVREDDKEATVRRRLEIYHSETQPLEDFYKARGKLATVVGQELVADTTALTLQALEKGN
ncbi:MAG: adenylate kinase [Clostridia bacterium]|nr:adenylate kinase [Clostridia bacterium]